LTTIEFNPHDFSLQKPLGHVFYNLNKFSTQKLKIRYVWRDMTVNLSYSMINENFLIKKFFEFKTSLKNKEDIKQTGIFFEAQFIFDKNLEMLKIVISKIISKRKNYSPGKFL
jgi:hypothetical protein